MQISYWNGTEWVTESCKSVVFLSTQIRIDFKNKNSVLVSPSEISHIF